MKRSCYDSKSIAGEEPAERHGRRQGRKKRLLRRILQVLLAAATLAFVVFASSLFIKSRGADDSPGAAMAGGSPGTAMAGDTDGAAEASDTTDAAEANDTDAAAEASEIAASDTASPIGWTFDEEAKTLTISGQGAMPDWEWDGSKVPWNKAALQATTIIVEDGVENIGAYAFWNAGEFGDGVTIYIPKSVEDISAHALVGWIKSIEVDAENPVYRSVDGALYDKSGSTLIQAPGSRRGRYIVPEGTGIIGDWAFEWCSYIQEIELPDGVTAIGDSAFSNCKALTKLLLPEGLLTIGNHIFKPEAMIFSRPVLSVPHSVQFIGENNFGRIPGMAGIDVYYAGTEEEWHAVSFAVPEGITGEYNMYFLGDRSDADPNNCPWLRYAGRWASGLRSEDTGNFYEEELTIRFTGSDSFVFTWRKHDAAELVDLCAAIDPETGIASFDDQIGAQMNGGRGTIAFKNGTVTLHIESSRQNEAVPDGYEVTFDTKESDRLQSARWFASQGA